MYYYLEQDNKILLFDTDLIKLQNTLNLLPQYKNLTIKETTEIIILYKNNFVFKKDVLDQLEEDEKNNKRESIKQEIEEYDKKRIRAVCEPAMKDENTTWLEYYNSQILKLREELSEI